MLADTSEQKYKYLNTWPITQAPEAIKTFGACVIGHLLRETKVTAFDRLWRLKS
jgi:hypothetical protein